MWQSTRPGSTVMSDRSMTAAPAGIVKSAPTALILPPLTRITWFESARPATTSMSPAGANGGDRSGGSGRLGAADRREQGEAQSD